MLNKSFMFIGLLAVSSTFISNGFAGGREISDMEFSPQKNVFEPKREREKSLRQKEQREPEPVRKKLNRSVQADLSPLFEEAENEINDMEMSVQKRPTSTPVNMVLMPQRGVNEAEPMEISPKKSVRKSPDGFKTKKREIKLSLSDRRQQNLSRKIKQYARETKRVLSMMQEENQISFMEESPMKQKPSIEKKREREKSLRSQDKNIVKPAFKKTRSGDLEDDVVNIPVNIEQPKIRTLPKPNLQALQSKSAVQRKPVRRNILSELNSPSVTAAPSLNISAESSVEND